MDTSEVHLSITQLLNLINLARKTGTLAFDTPEGQARLHFRNGQLIYATVNGQDIHLADILYQTGKITQEQAQAVRTVFSARSEKELGTLLAEMGYVSPDDILDGVRTFIRHSIHHMFTWSNGAYRFESDVPSISGRITTSVDLEAIVAESNHELERLHQAVPDLDAELRLVKKREAQPHGINLSAEEWRVVPLIGQPGNTIRQIAQRYGLNDTEIRRVVDGLLQAGLVEFAPTEEPTTPSPSRTHTNPRAQTGRPTNLKRSSSSTKPLRRLAKKTGDLKDLPMFA
jgi:transposase-like protein